MYKQKDRILAMCGATLYDQRAAYIGFYATRPELHGKGLGIKAWRRVMQYVADRNCGLCAAPSQIEVYRGKAGFVHEEPNQMLCFESSACCQELLLVDGSSSGTQDYSSSSSTAVIIESFREELLADVIAYDKALLKGFDRTSLLTLSFQEKGSLTKVAIEAASGKVVGFGTMRWSNVDKGMMGPLYAEGCAIAEKILRELIKYPQVAENGFMWMVLKQNKAAVELATHYGLSSQGPFESPRLYTKEVPEAPDVQKVFCLFSPDFGPY